MACLYKRRNRFWISFYLDGRLIQRSLGTTNERVAQAKKRQIEYELSLGDLHQASKLELSGVLSAFCAHLKATRTFKSYKNDISRLRIFFGPVCDALIPARPGPRGRQSGRPASDRYAHAHVKVVLLEEVTPEVINRFFAARIQRDGWAAKTANSMRQVLHQLFNYAAKHHGFRGRDRRYPNPAKGVDRLREPAQRIRFLTWDQIEQQLQVLEEYPVIHAMVATYILAGLRREEGVRLIREDVDLEQRLIRVHLSDSEIWYHLGGFSDEGDTYETQEYEFSRELDRFWDQLYGPDEPLRRKFMDCMSSAEDNWQSVTIQPSGYVTIKFNDGTEKALVPPRT